MRKHQNKRKRKFRKTKRDASVVVKKLVIMVLNANVIIFSVLNIDNQITMNVIIIGKKPNKNYSKQNMLRTPN